MLDVDGVLVTGRPDDGAFWTKDLQADLGIDPQLLQEFLFRPHWNEIACGQRDLRTCLEEFWPKLETNATPRQFLNYWFRMDARISQDVLADCAELRRQGHRIFLATNQEHLRARFLMQKLGLHAICDGICYSAAIGAQKPDRAFYDGAAAQAKDQAPLLVDDTPQNVTGARAAGWRAHLWTGQERLCDLMAP